MCVCVCVCVRVLSGSYDAASNMICGQFGGAHTDYVCVQSMDGQLSVFEQETLAFARYLPNFLIPGKDVYVYTTHAPKTL